MLNWIAWNTGWNNKIITLEKTTWFHFRLKKTGFLFLLLTIYLLASCVQIPRAIGAFYHVWKWHNVQRARSEMRRCITHAPYQSKLGQQDHFQHPQNANPDSSTCPGSLVWFQVRATSCHLTSSKLAWKSTPKCTWMSKVQRDPGLSSEGMQWLCTLLSLAPFLLQPEPAGLLRLVICREHHQHDLPQHQSQPDRCHLPSICRAPIGACGKGMLPVLDPYEGGDWGWRRLHWIDVSSTT